MTPSDITAHLVAGSIAATRLIPQLKPLLKKMPRWITLVVPIGLIALPMLLDYFGFVKSQLDFGNLIALAVALMLPGLSFKKKKKKKMKCKKCHDEAPDGCNR